MLFSNFRSLRHAVYRAQSEKIHMDDLRATVPFVLKSFKLRRTIFELNYTYLSIKSMKRWILTKLCYILLVLKVALLVAGAFFLPDKCNYISSVELVIRYVPLFIFSHWVLNIGYLSVIIDFIRNCTVIILWTSRKFFVSIHNAAKW